nr:hypothetical protein CFP56_12178 [Quercus suber]
MPQVAIRLSSRLWLSLTTSRGHQRARKQTLPTPSQCYVTQESSGHAHYMPRLYNFNPSETSSHARAYLSASFKYNVHPLTWTTPFACQMRVHAHWPPLMKWHSLVP